MYSHGSSARAGVGKQGHGGRNYRPPRPRKDPSSTPPPLKECSCLLQIDIPEYMQSLDQQQQQRTHTALGGRDAVRNYERIIRSCFTVHIVIPGRKQSGPIGIAGKSYREVIPAAAFLLSKVDFTTILFPPNTLSPSSSTSSSSPSSSYSLEGRIQLNVKRIQDLPISGRILLPPPPTTTTITPTLLPVNGLRPYWLFQSSTWNVLACPLVLNEEIQQQQQQQQQSLLLVLQNCVDNLKFRLGNNVLDDDDNGGGGGGVDIFIHEYPIPTVYAIGDPTKTTLLQQEIYK